MTPLTTKAAQFLDGNLPDAGARVRIVAGATLGSVLAVLAPVLGILWWTNGSEMITREGTIVRLDALTFVYPLGAILTGALVLLLAPYGRVRVAKALLGAVAFVPWMAAVAWCFNHGNRDWQVAHSLMTAFGAMVFGGPIGWAAHSLTASASRQGSHRSAI